MAYRRKSASRRAPARSGYGRRAKPVRAASARRAPSRRRATGRASTGGRAQTVRIVVEGLPASPVARRNPFERALGLTPQVDTKAPRKAKL